MDRFWNRVERGAPEDCWIWRGSKDRYGYGQFKAESGKSPVRAHRFAYLLTHGVEAGGIIRHTCHNPACCNPSHMQVGDARDNHEDRENARRCPRQGGRFVGLVESLL
jgi:hypothetical protein